MVGVWVAAAAQLWESRVPENLALREADANAYFADEQLARAESFERFLQLDLLAAELVTLVVLGLYAWRGHRLSKESSAGRIGTGMLLGMLGLGILWLTQIPFELAAHWWVRRHDLTEVGYVEWFIEYWATLAGEFGFVSLALLIVVGFAQTLRDRWWVAGAPVFVGIYALFAFTYPHLIPDARPLDDPELRRAAQDLAREQGVEAIPVEVEDVSAYTTAPNAQAAGLGETRRILLWDTLLDGRFSDDEIVVVLAHEIAHHSREHIWRGVGWYALFAVPGTLVIALATRRRGTLRDPRAVPLALFVFVALQLAAQPLLGVISRRMEAEADWVALETTEDPQAAEALFRHFTTLAFADPDPPAWATLLLGTHPSPLERIAMADAWRRHRGR